MSERLDLDEGERGRRALVFALGRVAAGDRRALEDVYRRTSAKLFAICLRTLSERADAEEALQDAYVSVWRSAAAYDPERASPLAWLATIARNRAIDRLRARGGRAALPLETVGEPADPGADPATWIEAREDEARMVACLAALRTDEAALIRSAFFEGLSYPFLAERAGQPLGTVKSRIRRALLKLRACLS